MTRSHTRTRGHRLDPGLPERTLPSDSGLLGPLEARAIANALDIRLTKVLGQNFVRDTGTIRRIVHARGVQARDEVVEVGPGLGSLTLAILERGTRARAVEIDPMLTCTLPETIHNRMPETTERFYVVLDDATKVKGLDDFGADWPAPTKLVANLPCNMAVPILLAVLEFFLSLSGVLVMVQSEAADRFMASPGSRVYSVPSVRVVWYRTAERARTIGRSIFWPVPSVDSTLIRLRRAGESRRGERLRRTTPEVCDVAFGQRRKTLRAALKAWAGSAQGAEALLERADIGPSARGRTLSIERFVILGHALTELREAGVLIEKVDPRSDESPRPSNEAKTTRSASSTLPGSPASDSEAVDNA